MKKRLIALLLAFVMVLGLTATVFAEGGISIASIQPEAPTHTYIFQAGGVEIGKQIIKHNELLKDPGVPSAPAGQRFVRWDPAVSFDMPVSVTQTQTITVQAIFETVYTVYFCYKDRTVATKELTDTQPSVSTGDVLVPVGADEKLTGWYIGGTRYETVSKADFLAGDTLTLTAKVDKGHWIHFDSAGGSYVAPQFVTGNTIQPADPARPGFSFEGWYEESGNRFTFGSPLTSNITLIAHWTSNTSTKYTVIHWQEKADESGWSLHETETKTGGTGAQTAAAAKSYDGFTAQTITQQTINGDGSTIVNVYYKRNVYDVKFYEKKGWLIYNWEENTDYRITAKHGANISKKWPGGIWTTSPGGSTFQANIDTMPLNGTKFYKTSQGDAKAYYYLESLAGGYVWDHTDTGGDSSSIVTNEDRYPITGFICNTAKSAKNGAWYNGAKFYYDRNSYQIVFMNRGSKEKELVRKYEQSIADAGYTPTAPANMQDYTFGGWFDNEKCEGSAYVFTGKKMPAHHLTLYAKWVPKTYSVTVYDVDRTKILKTFDVPMGETILESQMPEVTLGTGDSFLGWMDMQDNMPFHFDTKIHRDYQLYAKTGNAEQFEVTYALGDGSGKAPVDSNKYARGAQAVVLPATGVTPPEGKVFLYWSAAGDSTRCYPGGKLTVTGYMTLTAVYGQKTEAVTVTYHSNFAPDKTDMTAAMPNNSTITLPGYTDLDLPENQGYTFAGWNTQADGLGTTYMPGEKVLVDTMEPGNHLYAIWVKGTGTPYEVHHYLERLEGAYPDVPKEKDNLRGETGAWTAAAAKSYDGFTPIEFEQKRIKADDSTVVEIFYTRNSYLLTYKDSLSAGVYASQTYKYRAAVTAIADPTKTGYTFTGWSPAVPDTMPAEARTVYAQWRKTTPDTVVFDPNNINGKTLAAKSLTVYSGSAPWETFEVVVKEPAGTQRSSGTVRLSGGSQSASFTGFDLITFPAAGTYTFTVGEVDRNTRYMSYDRNLYTLTVKVEEKGGMLVISDVYYTNAAGRSYRDFPIVFSNTYGSYTPYVPVVPPKTPDKLNADDHFAYVIGYPDGGVHPHATITRAETATIFFRLLTEKTRKDNLTKYHSFRDVPQGAWYNAAVATMAKLKIITGYPDGTFQPDAPVTRAEFAAIAARFDEKSARTTASFRDIYGHWAERYISRSAELGWIRGYTDNTFRPDQSITRAEAMALINRVLNRNPESKDDLLRSMNIFNDNLDTAKWYYLDVQEAANSHDFIRKANGYEMWKKLRADPDWKALER
jgi:pilin isopeptide linkage protein/uncharacterized repeat protein (TIGR02543 family)